VRLTNLILIAASPAAKEERSLVQQEKASIKIEETLDEWKNKRDDRAVAGGRQCNIVLGLKTFK
jgi:hypothetical protein